jgi:hypothetical protein
MAKQMRIFTYKYIVTPFYGPGSKDAVEIMLDSAYLKFL